MQELVLAGAITRPSLSHFKADQEGFKWIKKLTMAWVKGDDGLLRAVVHLLEEEGFCIKSPQDYLCHLLTPKGCLTTRKPSMLSDIDLGKEVLTALSPFDIGQAVIVNECRVLGVEGVDGTDQLIARHNEGVLVKMAKKNQMLSVDLPSIGPNTVLQGKNLKGIALQAHRTQILNKEKVIEMCEEFGLFLLGF